MAALMAEYRVAVAVTLLLLLFFLWMDINLYYQIQSLPPAIVLPSRPPPPTVSVEKSSTTALMRAFEGLSVKLMMMDQPNNYIFTPLATIFDKVTQFSPTFPSVSPNSISITGIFCAIISGRLMICDNFAAHRLAVLFFQFRTFFDALDGVVARYHMGIKRHISLRDTSGFVVDGLADTIGFLAFLIGCYLYLRRNLPKTRHQYLPLQAQDSFSERSPASAYNKFAVNSSLVISQYVPQQLVWNSKHVFFVVFCFAFQLALSAFFWNRYIEAYHQLLETPAKTQEQAMLQNEVLRSSVMFVIIWFWRVSCAMSLMQMLLLAVFLNRLWDFLNWVQCIGFIEILTLSFFTELHLNDVASYLSRVT